jgi:hypothetical protein
MNASPGAPARRWHDWGHRLLHAIRLACFIRVIYKGAPIVKGKRVTGFANSEEEEVHLTKVVPFLALCRTGCEL